MNIDSNTSKKMFSTNDLAKILNLSKTSIYRIIGKREIPFHKIGGAIRFDKEDIEEYLLKNRIESIT